MDKGTLFITMSVCRTVLSAGDCFLSLVHAWGYFSPSSLVSLLSTKLGAGRFPAAASAPMTSCAVWEFRALALAGERLYLQMYFVLSPFSPRPALRSGGAHTFHLRLTTIVSLWTTSFPTLALHKL